MELDADKIIEIVIYTIAGIGLLIGSYYGCKEWKRDYYKPDEDTFNKVFILFCLPLLCIKHGLFWARGIAMILNPIAWICLICVSANKAYIFISSKVKKHP